MIRSGYEALRRSAAWIDLGGRGKLAVRGPDRARLVHALTTNDIRGLSPGQGCYAFFLKVNGRVLADANVFCVENQILIDTEPETREIVANHIEEYTIADDAETVDLTDELTTIAVEGPCAERVLNSSSVPVPPGLYGAVAWPAGWTARVDTTGAGGFFLFTPYDTREEIVAELERSGAIHATAEEARTVRIENGKPRYGEEITARFLADETAQHHAIHRQKGCYLGQEVVERVHARNLLAIQLVQVRLDKTEVLPPGTKLFHEDRKRGEIVSCVYSPALGSSIAMAYVHKELTAEGAVFTVQAGTRTITATSHPAVESCSRGRYADSKDFASVGERTVSSCNAELPAARNLAKQIRTRSPRF